MIATQIDAHLWPEELKARFWSLVERKSRGECWPWARRPDRKGYGCFWVPTHQAHRKPHRITLELHLGRGLAPLELACHHCDNRICCNPYHLFVGSHADNAHDRDRKGRYVVLRGSLNGLAKLTEPNVLEMRRLRASGWILEDLARRYGISIQSVWRTVNGMVWKHVV